MQKANRNHWMLIVAVLFVTPVLAGCFGDDAPKAAEDDQGEGVEVKKGSEGSGDEEEDVPKNTDHSGAKNAPSAHYHHYWGDPPAPQVIIYDGPVPFNNYDAKYLRARNTLAWAQFGLEDDQDDVKGGDRDPVSSGGIADTVFAGADRITVHFPTDFPDGVSAMRFQYKPANTPIFFPEGGGRTVFPGQVEEIKLNEIGMTDPPHQFTASRWEFRLFATNALCDQYNLEQDQCPPAVIQQQEPPNTEEGTKYVWGSRGAGLYMIAHNGGEKALDPPHPDFWKGADVLDLGTVDGEVTDPVVVTPLVRERINQLTEIAMPPNYIVPLGTEYVEVRVKWDNTAPTADAADVFMKLFYHGADDIEFKEAPEPTQDGDWWVYQIFDEKGTLVDPPYESNSFWRFKLVPSMDLNGQMQENMGVFSGTWEMEFKAHKIPGFVLE